ncbi:MAG: hypothetical protein IKX67_08805 [Bacteroidales bacterium]|nr:hypothetical protein [Bacteroidales bacterium]
MAKKTSTPTPPVPDEFRRQYQSKFAPIPCEPNYKRGIERLSDEAAGRLLKAILEHTVTGSTTPPQGMDAFAFDMFLSKVDEFLEYGLENSWKRQYRAHYGASERWNREPEIPQENALASHSMLKNANNNINNNANVNDNDNTNTNRNAQARGMVGNGGEWPEVNLSDYLTPEEEERLFEGAANYETGFLERFVLSSYYCREDSLYQKTEKALKFRDEENARYYAEKEAAEKEREAAEDAKSVEEIKAELKAKARTLSGYSNGQRPRDLEELQSFCKDLGCPDFPAVLLWSEMEFHGWEIHEGDTWRAVKSWKGLVIHRIAVEKCEG